MTQKAEVIIIGGGVIGTSIAYHLAKQGAGHIMLLERAASILKLCCSDPCDCRGWGFFIYHFFIEIVVLLYHCP